MDNQITLSPVWGNKTLIPRQLLLGFLFALPFILVWSLGKKTELPQWQAAMLVAAVAVVIWLFGSRQRVIWTWLHTLVALSLAANLVLSIVHTGTPGVQEGLQQQVTLTLFFFFGAQYLSNQEGRQLLLRVTVWSASLVSVIGITQYLTSSTLGLPATSANASVFINKNYAGAFMDLATPAAFILLLAAKEKRTMQWRTVAFFLCLSYSLISLSRGHWLSMAAALSLLLLLFSRNKTLKEYLSNNKTSQMLAALVMIAAPMMLLFPSMGSDISAESTVAANQLSDSSSIGDRFDFYRNTLQMISDNPWSGIGSGAFYNSFQEYYAAPATLELTTELMGIGHAHNDYLEYLAELGIPGGLIIIALLAVIWHSGWQLANHSGSVESSLTGAAFLGGITAILAHASVDFPLSMPVSSIYLWVWAGSLSSTWRTTTSDNDLPAEPVNHGLRRILAGLATLYLGLTAYHGYLSFKGNLTIAQAIDATKARQCAKAIGLSDEAMNLAPKDYLIWHHHLLVIGFCENSLKGQFLAAAKVLEQDPDHPYATLTQANVLYQAGSMSEAATSYQRLIQLLPHRISGYLGLANTFMASGDEQQAKRLYAKAEDVRKQIGRRWYVGPAGRALAALTVKASGDDHWAAPARKRGLSTRIVGTAPAISGAADPETANGHDSSGISTPSPQGEGRDEGI